MNIKTIARLRESKTLSSRATIARALVAVPLLLLSAAPALAGSFLLEPMNFVAGQTQSDATDINDSGQVAAQYRDSSGKLHGVIWNNGAVTHVDLGYDSFLLHINAQGVAVGATIASCCSGTWKAFVYDPVTLVTRIITAHGGYGAFPNGINASDVVVGLYVDGAGIAHGFVGVCAAGQAPCTNGHIG